MHRIGADTKELDLHVLYVILGLAEASNGGDNVNCHMNFLI